MPKAYLIHIIGIVQGVGFRPYVKILADQLGLSGYVKNLGGGEVEIYVEGERSREFLDSLLNGRPKAIYIEDIRVIEVAPRGVRGFTIEKSSQEVETVSMIPPDLAICDECLREVLEGDERRRRYPFNSCSFCGPRFSIIKKLPYDRENTSWTAFPLCDKCTREYNDPKVGGIRRFYYQGISCKNDGPQVKLLDSTGEPIDVGDPISEASRLINEGYIVAVKGVGGFHIFALASDDDVVAKLRKRKKRPTQPFAIMALDLETAGRLAVVNKTAAELLTSPQRPIVLLFKREDSPASPLVSPGLDKEGIFLPYTALQYLLLSDIRDKFAIATSGNIHGEPMCTDWRCVAKLGVADYILDHTLEIVHRVDDSVVRFTAGRPTLLRRGRGYAPVWIKTPLRLGRAAVAFGADLQTAGGVGIGDKAILTQYIGDLDSFKALEDLDRELRWLVQTYRLREFVLVCDLNQTYNSHRLCREWAEEFNAEIYMVQHHHAHALATAADVGIAEPFVAVAIDGVGLGEDGAAWGGEVLYVDGARYERVRHLAYVPMPGGDLAALRPARMALAYLFKYFGEDWDLVERLKLAERLPGGLSEAQIVAREVKKPRLYTSSVGRFLDAVAAVLGVAWERTYEGEPAIRLETTAAGGKLIELEAEDQVELFGQLIELYLKGADVKDLAYTAQYKLGQILGKWACETAERKGVRHIVVGGGAAVNDYIIAGLESICRRAALPSKTPPGDGGIALGQLYYLAHLGI